MKKINLLLIILLVSSCIYAISTFKKPLPKYYIWCERRGGYYTNTYSVDNQGIHFEYNNEIISIKSGYKIYINNN